MELFLNNPTACTKCTWGLMWSLSQNSDLFPCHWDPQRHTIPKAWITITARHDREEKRKKQKFHSKTLKNETKPPYKHLFYTSKFFTANLVEPPFYFFLEGLKPCLASSKKIKNSKKNFPFNLLLNILILPERAVCITSLISSERALTTPPCVHQFAGIHSPGLIVCTPFTSKRFD